MRAPWLQQYAVPLPLWNLERLPDSQTNYPRAIWCRTARSRSDSYHYSFCFLSPEYFGSLRQHTQSARTVSTTSSRSGQFATTIGFSASASLENRPEETVFAVEVLP